jgi:hypothetical protein
LPAFVEEAFFSLSYIFGTFVKNRVVIVVWIHMQVLYSVSPVIMSVFVPAFVAVFIAVAL